MHIDTYSETLRRAVRMDVILPDRRGGFCPPWKTLYLLHGMTDDHSMWQRRSAIERYADEAGLAVIKPDTGLKWYTDTAWGERYFSYIADELPQIMERMLPGLSRRRADRYIAGLSMGGYGALKCALSRPERFSMAAALSGAVDVAELAAQNALTEDAHYWPDIFGPVEQITDSENDLFALAQRCAGPRPKLFMWCGTEDFLYDMNLRMRDHLRALGYDLDYRESSGDHQWQYWDREIQSVVAWILANGEANACH